MFSMFSPTKTNPETASFPAEMKARLQEIDTLIANSSFNEALVKCAQAQTLLATDDFNERDFQRSKEAIKGKIGIIEFKLGLNSGLELALPVKKFK
jgi:hypothetical protein